MQRFTCEPLMGSLVLSSFLFIHFRPMLILYTFWKRQKISVPKEHRKGKLTWNAMHNFKLNSISISILPQNVKKSKFSDVFRRYLSRLFVKSRQSFRFCKDYWSENSRKTVNISLLILMLRLTVNLLDFELNLTQLN